MGSPAAGLAADGPTLLDRAFQLAYVCAYRMMRVYWSVRRPTTNGALVTLWNRGEVLLVRNSYVNYYTLPGGYLRRGETSRQAALRELREEVGVSAASDDLRLLIDETHEWEGKHDHVSIFALELEDRPKVKVDNREVVHAAWYPPDQALKLDLFPPLRRAIEQRKAANAQKN
jgi:ADP-ribose pyrophosphatase YjhB (NUDIX family)